MKIIRYLLIILPLIVLLLFCTLFFTNTGLRFIGQNVVRYSSGMLSIGEVKGRLSDEFTLGDLRVATPGMSLTIGRLTWRWSPKSLFLGKLHLEKLAVQDVEVSVAGQSSAPPSQATPAVPPPISLVPIGIVLDNVLVENIRVTDGDGNEVVAVHSLTARLKGAADRLTVDSLRVESTDIGFALHGNVRTGRDWAVDLAGQYHLANFGFHPLQGTFSALGPLQTPHLELIVNSSGIIRAALDVVNLLEKPEWNGTLTAEDVDLSALILDCPKILLSTVSGELSGDLGHYRGQVKAEGSWDTLQGMRLVSQLSGDEGGIDFQSLRIDRGESVAEAENG
ncbi:MAG: hypothetical protein ACWGOX_07480, partial [Desulforhopalus sp.]